MIKETIATKKPAVQSMNDEVAGKKEMFWMEKFLCGSGTESISPANEVSELIKKGAFLLDVRTMFEARKGMAPGATNIPLLRLKSNLQKLPKNKTIITYCGTGGRAGKAKDILESSGFNVINGGGYEGILTILRKN